MLRFSPNKSQRTVEDPDLDARFVAVEGMLQQLVNLANVPQVASPSTLPAQILQVLETGAGGGGGGSSNVEPGTVDGQVLRWNDAEGLWEPAANVLIDTDGDVVIDATLLIVSQANTNAFAVREKTGGQSQPVAVFQTESGFSAVRFTPSAALVRVLPESVGGGIWGSDGFQGTPAFLGRRAQGTQDTPTPALSGNVLVALQGLAFTSGGYESTPPGSFEFVATENHTPTNRGTEARVNVTPNGSAVAVVGLDVTNAKAEVPGHFVGGTDTPGAFGADQNNLALGDGWIQELSATGATRTITGFVATQDGDKRIIYNIGATQSLVIANESGSSTAANQVVTGTGLDITLAPNESITMYYSGSTSRWRVL